MENLLKLNGIVTVAINKSNPSLMERSLEKTWATYLQCSTYKKKSIGLMQNVDGKAVEQKDDLTNQRTVITTQ